MAGQQFGATVGYSVANEEQEKNLDLTTAPASWPRLDEEVARHLGDYRIETVDTVVPDHLIGGLAELLSSFYSHVPLGDTDLHDSEWTPERMRAHEERLLAIGRSIIYGVAVAPDGSVAGMSDIRVSRADPEVAEVGLTIVAPEHRGHRLGLAVKLAGHRRVLADFPDCVRAIHLQRHHQHGHERRQRAAGLRRHRAADGAAEAARLSLSLDPQISGLSRGRRGSAGSPAGRCCPLRRWR